MASVTSSRLNLPSQQPASLPPAPPRPLTAVDHRACSRNIAIALTLLAAGLFTAMYFLGDLAHKYDTPIQPGQGLNAKTAWSGMACGITGIGGIVSLVFAKLCYDEYRQASTQQRNYQQLNS